MPLTQETLPRHELNGLRVRVVDAPNSDLIGISGRVVVETTNTLSVESDASDRRGESDATDRRRGSAGESDLRVRQVPKAGTTFEFAIPSTTDGGSGEASEPSYVVVDGDRLVSRPARRTETKGDSKWR